LKNVDAIKSWVRNTIDAARISQNASEKIADEQDPQAREIKLGILRQRELLLRSRVEERNGQLINRAEVEQSNTAKVQAIKNAMHVAARRVADALANLPDSRVAAVAAAAVEKEMKAIANTFEAGGNAYDPDAETKQPAAPAEIVK
jgi:hypothetical protein